VCDGNLDARKSPWHDPGNALRRPGWKKALYSDNAECFYDADGNLARQHYVGAPALDETITRRYTDDAFEHKASILNQDIADLNDNKMAESARSDRPSGHLANLPLSNQAGNFVAKERGPE
ncbi:unnamed protein product, partial [Prorocentrum cordatum]